MINFYIVLIFYVSYLKSQDVYLKLNENVTQYSPTYNFCGSGKLTHSLGVLVYEFCKDAESVNHCCAKHDDCYDQQQGKIFCDNEFHQCTHKLDCSSVSVSSYEIVKLLGKRAYELSANHNNQVIFLPSTSVIEFDVDYQKLFSICYRNRSVLSSCILKNQICVNNLKTDCSKSMISCLHEIVFFTNDECEKKISEIIDKYLC